MADGIYKRIRYIAIKKELNLKQYLLGLKEKLGFELNGYFLL